MPPEEEDETGAYRASSGEERVWLHPSELGALLPPLPSNAPAAAPARPRRSRIPVAAVPVLSGMVGACLTVGALAAGGAFDRGPERVVERVANLPDYPLNGGATEDPEGVSGAASAVAPSIVAVRTSSPEGDRLGTGVVFRSDGHLLTNHHIVDGANSIEVTTADGRSWAARHAGSDRGSDLAVLAVPGLALEAAVMGSAGELRVGQMVVVVGAPARALGTPSVTAGVIAALGDAVEVNGVPVYDVISTDAMIGPRASGGPLVDRRGAVVGITTRAAENDRGWERFGLVIPIERARRMADQIITSGRVTQAWLGIEGSDLDLSTAREYGTGQGTLVRHVATDSPAERAGVERQDVVTAVGASPIASMHELMTMVTRHAPGDRLDLTVVRAGLTHRLKVRLTEAPAG